MDASTWLRAILSLGVVLGLLGLLSIGLRRLQRRGFLPLARVARSGRRRRFTIEDQLTLDARRRLVAVSDEVKHYVILLSPQRETLVACYDRVRADAKDEASSPGEGSFQDRVLSRGEALSQGAGSSSSEGSSLGEGSLRDGTAFADGSSEKMK